MMNKQVYLAGPITGLSFGACTDWREFASRELAGSGIKGLSPMRAKEYLAHLDKISGTGEEYVHLGVFSTPRAVMTRDHFDATRCDVLLANLAGAKQVSTGTVMEIAWAFTHKIPIVCVIEDEGNPHAHMMIHEAIGFRVKTLEEAVHVVKAILA
jgi:nucleoside 2-deoxyribosyltransferase